MTILDLQSSTDDRNLSINQVGIKSLRHAAYVVDRSGEPQPTVATFDLSVSLPATDKGTHMSRFIEILQEKPPHLGVTSLPGLLDQIATRLNAKSAFASVQFPFFRLKSAPVSGVQSSLDYDVRLDAKLSDQDLTIDATVVIPITTLCPCSKGISEYGAHNQRSHVTLTISMDSTQPIYLDEMIEWVEARASCELFSLLKRPDEKWVTERAYDNPKFVEDIVRDIAGHLNTDSRIKAYSVASENFESIHNHSAFAVIERDLR